MSDHLDAPDGPPGMDPRLDICDLFVFRRPDDPGRTVMVLNVNPFAPTGADEFHPDAIYEILVDDDGDAVPDIAYRFTFSSKEGGMQLATLRVARDEAAADIESRGDTMFEDVALDPLRGTTITEGDGFQFFIGMRSDPFFFDLAGYLGAMNFTGADHFHDKNVFSIVMELPNEALGPEKVGIWARVSAPRDDVPLAQIDRMGRPFINIGFVKDKDAFNHSEPTQDRELFMDQVVELLTGNGHDAGNARQEAMRLLPDILEYNTALPTRYPNGRTLSDDIIDHQLALITAGKVTSDGVGPHDDILDEFPYLGTPHPGKETIEELVESSQQRAG